MRKGITFVISAPSGAGKSTLSRMLLEEFDQLKYSVSCTTRSRRDGERDGIDYHFISRKEFDAKRVGGEFVEWAEVHGNLYGTPRSWLEAELEQGHDVLFDVDVQGAAQIKMSLPGSCFTFILPPSLPELERRLRSRGKDDDASIAYRMQHAEGEIKEAMWYDALVLNDFLETAYAQLRAVYIAATLAPAQNSDLVEKILNWK